MKKRHLLSVMMLGVSLLLIGCSANQKTDSSEPPIHQENSGQTATTSGTVHTNFDTDFKNAVEGYRKFVIEQSDLFVKATGEFVAAVKSGDLDKSKALYAPTRMYYERIEPIAESFGDLDPNIDARENDVDEKEWRGFHRIEKALWVDQTTNGMESFADQLLNDAKQLRALVETVEIDPSMLITGAVELLNEVSSTKVTGEEERYSHTDLYDFAANVEGALKIFELLQPALEKKEPTLAKTIEARFDDVFQALAPYKKGDGYVLYTELTQEETKKLSQVIDALAEPLSNMGTILGT